MNDPRSEDRDLQFTATLARGLQILLCFTPATPRLANRDLIAQTGLDKATVSRLVFTLVELGYLRRLDPRGPYQLGTAVLALGYPLLAAMRLRQLARPPMKLLADAVGGTVSMAIRDRDRIVYVETVRAVDRRSPLVDIGLSLPLAATALGRAWLAAAPREEREAVLNRLRVQDPAMLRQHRAGIEQAAVQLRQHGFCVNPGILDPERIAVAVPMVRPVQGELVVFNCTLLAEAGRRAELRRETGPRLVQMVRELEATLGMR